MGLVWQRHLGFFVNSVAIAHDGGRVVAGTYYYPYPGAVVMPTDGTFGTYCFDAQGTELWRDEYLGNEGVYTVAISGNGQVVASAGLATGGAHSSQPAPSIGLVRAFTAANGGDLLDFQGLRGRVTSISLSHDGSVLAGITLGGQLFVFSGPNGFPATPVFPVQMGPKLEMVAVHPSGDWLIACGREGKVHLVTLDTGAPRLFTWTAPASNWKLLACALAASTNTFVVGGQNRVYLFTRASMTGNAGPQPVAQFDTPRGCTSEDVRWLAMSADGSLVTVVQNLGNDIAGLLLTLSINGNQFTAIRPPQLINHNPNSTSLDAAGKLLSVADGHPVQTPGTFYLFRVNDGKKLMEFETPDMNWPMVLSADGTAAAGGSDNGDLYYFTP